MQESMDDLLLEPTLNLYIFFYDDELKVEHRDDYDKNIQLLIELYDDSCKDGDDACKSKFVIVDMNLHPQEEGDHETKLIWYKNKQLQSTNLLKNKSPNDYTGITH